MNSRTLIALLASLAVLVALAIAVSVSQRPDQAAGGPFLPGLREQLNEVSQIVVRTGGNRTVATLKRNGDGWTLAERNDYPADVGRIRQSLIALAEAQILEEKTSNPEYYERLKVDDIDKANAAGVRLDILAGEQTTSVIIGTTGVGGGERAYARRAGEPASWLISGRIDAPRETAEWLDRLITDIDAKRIQAVTITHPDGEVLRIARDSPDAGDFTVAKVPAGRKLSFPGVGNPIGAALSDLRLDSVEPAAGFAPGAVKPVTARFEARDGLVVEVQSFPLPGGSRLRVAASADEALAARFADSKPAGGKPASESEPEPASNFEQVKAEAARLQARHAAWVYAVPEYKAEQFTRRMEDLLESRIAGPPRPE